MIFDKTNFVLTVSLLSVFSILSMLFLSVIVKKYSAIKLWVIGNTLISCGFLLLALPNNNSNFPSIFIVNILLELGFLVLFLGITNFVGKPLSIKVFIISIISYGILFIIASSLSSNYITKAVIISFVAGVISLFIGYTLARWCLRALRFTHWISAILFFYLGITQIIRGFGILRNPSLVDLSSQEWIQIADYPTLAIVFLIWTIAAIFMVIQRLSVELSETSRMDFLTQVLNRQAMQERLYQEVKHTERKKGLFSLVLVDIDDFQEINEDQGYQAGDSVLKQVTGIIQKNLRVEDVISRWGVDEFLILLSDSPVTKAVEVSRRLQNLVKVKGIHYQDNMIECAMSMGVAGFIAGESKIEEVIINAETALNDAKLLGGNRVNIYHKK